MKRAEACGKQVKLDGYHLADATSEAAAAVIADCINNAGNSGDAWNDSERERVEAYLA